MGRFTIKSALAGLTSVLAATSIFAVDALVDDNEDKTNANEFEAYWYYYDDNSGTKEDDRPQAAPSSTPSVINVPFEEVNREAFGDPGDTHKVKDYTFTTATEGTNSSAMMPFTYGEEWEASYGDATPYVGIGTMLAPDGKNIDLTGAESVTFKLRARVQELSVVFKVETQDISDDSTFAYYQKAITVGTDWETFTVGLNTDDLQQPGWTPAAAERDLAIDQVTKIAWEVPGGSNDITGDTLEVDDVVITNYEFVSPSVFPNDAALGQKAGAFATFEKELYKDATSLNTYWYAYNDGAIGGNSSVAAGATENDSTKLLTLKFEAGSGSDGAGHAPYLAFTLGKSIQQASSTGTGTVDVQGFVGIGVNLYDSATTSYFNANTGKRGTKGSEGTATGVYFEYQADGDFKYMTVELSDINDVGDATNPTRKDSRGSGIVYYRNFLKTGTGVWKAVSLSFSDLIVHDDWEGYTEIPLDLTQLAKLQFKVQGAEGQSGQIFVDNVCFPGLAVFPNEPVAISHSITRSTSSDFAASFKNGNVMVNWKTGSAVSGKINLINTKGAVVASAPVAKNAALNTSISASRIPAGLYFVQFKGVDVNGKAVSQRSAVSIVK